MLGFAVDTASFSGSNHVFNASNYFSDPIRLFRKSFLSCKKWKEGSDDIQWFALRIHVEPTFPLFRFSPYFANYFKPLSDRHQVFQWTLTFIALDYKLPLLNSCCLQDKFTIPIFCKPFTIHITSNWTIFTGVMTHLFDSVLINLKRKHVRCCIFILITAI